jgi:hypothetical protein
VMLPIPASTDPRHAAVPDLRIVIVTDVLLSLAQRVD